MDVAGPVIEPHFLHFVVPRVGLAVSVTAPTLAFEGHVLVNEGAGIPAHAVISEQAKSFTKGGVVGGYGPAFAHGDGFDRMKGKDDHIAIDAFTDEDIPAGVRTGIGATDSVTGVFDNGEIVLAAARPAMSGLCPPRWTGSTALMDLAP